MQSNNKIVQALLPIFLFILCAYPALGLAAIDQNTVAVIDGTPLTKSEFDRRYKENIKIFRFTPPTKANVLNDIINFELGVKEAKKLKLDKLPEVQERLSSVLYSALIDHVLSEKFKKAVDISEAEARNYCKKYPEIRTSHVFVPLKVSSLKAEEEEALKTIKTAQAELAKGKKFEEVVAKYSAGYNTSSGGDVGYLTKDKLDPSYYSAATKLKVGQTTKSPVRSQYGYHIIKLTGIHSCNDINIPEWQRLVFDEKRAQIFEEYLGSLRKKAKVSINNNLIKE